MVRITGKMHYALDVMSYFTQHQWNFRSNNLVNLFNKMNKEDQDEFNFDMSSIKWSEFTRISHYGNRRHLLKESDETIPMARKRMARIELAYRLFKVLIIAVLAYLISWLPLYLFFGAESEECRLSNTYYTLYTSSLIVGGIYLYCNRS